MIKLHGIYVNPEKILAIFFMIESDNDYNNCWLKLIFEGNVVVQTAPQVVKDDQTLEWVEGMERHLSDEGVCK